VSSPSFLITGATDATGNAALYPVLAIKPT